MNLLATDFDGTFFDNNYENNIKMVQKLKNFHFVIITGRNFSSLKKDLKIECKYYICNDGGYILDNNLNLLYRNFITDNTINKIYSRILKLGYTDYFFDSIEEFSGVVISNVNKISIKIKDNNAFKDIEYLLKDLNDVYAYISTNWINILSNESKKSKGIDFITKLNNYDNIYVIGNDINDFDMLEKYNGFLISNTTNKEFHTVKNFLELENKIKK